ncbi:MAG TPA: Uma2 family endonuclease [Gemmataceae bacterium]|jgi:Uma2 family endonuclease|nr:Uma2 family endonuclease [Gemmataceae bacterium]
MIAKFGFDDGLAIAETEIPDGYEMVDGELVEMPPMSEESNWIGGQLFAVINEYCRKHNLGRVYPQDTPFRGFPGDRISVRKPDASFVRRERLSDRLSKRDLTIAPDLAAEILSPNDAAVEVNKKIEQYLAAGVRLVWIVDPDLRIVYVHRPNGPNTVVRAPDELSGEDVLPGFRCSLDSFIPPVDQTPPSAE